MARQKVGSTKKRRKTVGKKRRSTHRRRVGASGGIEPIVMNGLAVGVGIVAARELAILAGSLAPSLMASPIVTGAGEIAVGGVTAYMSKNGFVRLAGLGAIGNGIMTILNGAGIIGGPQTMQYQFANRRQMGDPRLQFVAGPQTRIGSYPNNFGQVAGRKKRYAS